MNVNLLIGAEIKVAGVLRQVFMKALGISKFPMLAYFLIP